MQLPTEKLEITSHRPGIGWLIAAYKKIIHLAIGPYLRNVFEKEHALLNNRFDELQRQADERQRQADERQRQADERQRQVDDLCNELIKRMDSIAVILNKRQEDLDKRQEDLDKRLATLRYRFEYYIDSGETKIKDDLK